ncbi:MAG: SDR family oxidoreductase [Gemmatimonadaceae bacterium]|nr:SDR family oxidoreductase [Gemmatimonadaceae bacterium]
MRDATFNDGLLTGKIALVTGGGTGLGRAMAERFLQLGANVVICGRREAVLTEAAEQMMAEEPGEVLAIPCDIRDPDAVDAMIARAWEHFGHVDILVNNAAGNIASPTERLSHRAVDAVLGIVLHGSFYCTLALGKKWIAEGRKGRVLSIVTTYSVGGSAYVVPSAAAKAGVLAMTQSLAVEWGPKGITCNAIAPGPFPTKGAWDRLLPDPSLLHEALDRIPMRRPGELIELSNLAAFLVSDAASYINGECIGIDGGEKLKGAGQFSWMSSLAPEQWAALEASARGATAKDKEKQS